MFQPQELYEPLADALKSWDDTACAQIISTVARRAMDGARVDPDVLARWIRVHPDDAVGVCDCLLVDPPAGVDVLKVLSRAGSQKVVFLASWQIAQKEVVLKKFVGEDAGNRILQRESQTHPLSMAHPNIIETHLLQNANNEHFLVEKLLPLVLHDEWEARGVQEAANLLRDVANALAFLHEQGLIHGDVKPDNIGFEGGRYILLDFGICRPERAFTEDVTATGSLRTRAPEILVDEGGHTFASDLWALGATVYNALARRFPLFEEGEAPPRVSSPENRGTFEDELRRRVDSEWESRVVLEIVPDGLRDLLSRVLARDPAERLTASELVKEAENQLSAVLRFREDASNFSPTEEIAQLAKYLPSQDILARLSENQQRELRDRIQNLREAKGLTDLNRTTLAEIERRVP